MTDEEEDGPSVIAPSLGVVGRDDVGDPEVVGDVVVGSSVDTVVVVGAIVPFGRYAVGVSVDGVVVVGLLVEGDVVVGTFVTGDVIGMIVVVDVVGLAVVVVGVIVVEVDVGTDDGGGVVGAFVVGLVVVGASVNTTGRAMGDIVGPYVGTSDVFGTTVTGEFVIGDVVVGDVVDIVSGESVASTVGTDVVVVVVIGEFVAGGGTTTSLGAYDGIADAVGAWDFVGTTDVVSSSICRIAPFGLTFDVVAIDTVGEDDVLSSSSSAAVVVVGEYVG